ncbi:Alpha/beta hydrolase family protein [Arthrobacter ulcerisalmonis]|uniref:Alpha/beta hydrolase family protein n=1 Tax=Arthrobacter ulcerisalmonis TaxID=2483813 RepID=A0A3P5WCW0_9MICC|nr:alpha/beta hydrolase [Arthrobacter ulcerisalmonis]VDC18247.1 Alpha/beta hydrolase family protein [Arthrobacter ulcerisalmonis]
MSSPQRPPASTTNRRPLLYWASLICVAALILIPAWMLAGNPAVLGGHPLLPALLVVAAVVGLLWGVLLWRRRRRRAAPQRSTLRSVGAWVGRVAVLGLVAVLAWLNPFAYQPGSRAEAGPKSDYVVTETPTAITMVPDGKPAARGLIFYPGARVDAKAYQDILAPVVGAGLLVVILKEPLGLSLLDGNQAESAIADNPDITTWTVGGHSLGGVSASSFAQDNAEVKGLLLYGSYPLDSLRGRPNLAALSVSGSADGLSTPEKIDASRELLPADTDYVTIEGGVHAFFGNYGPQPGDGEPGISMDAAQEQISAATVEFLQKVGSAG